MSRVPGDDTRKKGPFPKRPPREPKRSRQTPSPPARVMPVAPGRGLGPASQSGVDIFPPLGCRGPVGRPGCIFAHTHHQKPGRAAGGPEDTSRVSYFEEVWQILYRPLKIPTLSQALCLSGCMKRKCPSDSFDTMCSIGLKLSIL